MTGREGMKSASEGWCLIVILYLQFSSNRLMYRIVG